MCVWPKKPWTPIGSREDRAESTKGGLPGRGRAPRERMPVGKKLLAGHGVCYKQVPLHSPRKMVTRHKLLMSAALVLGTLASAAEPKTLAPHPRLFVSGEQIARVIKGRGEAYAEAYRQVEAAAARGVQDAADPMREISPFGRGFVIGGRLISLAIQWHRTHDRRYLEAAVKTIEGMKSWLPPRGQITLQEGQYIAAVAIAYDLLYNDLTPDERARLVAFAREHCLQPFLRVTGERGSWWQRIVSNWNPVCVSGPGMLALAMYEDIPEAQTVVDRVQDSLAPIFDYLQETRGGWVEGLGYWNWTMHYTSIFLMSYERATGQRHPGFRSDGFREAMLFGQHFVPYDEECGFGDNQHGGLDATVLAAAEFLGDRDVLKRLQMYQQRVQETEALKRKLRRDRQPTAPPNPTDIGYWVPLRLLVEPEPATDVPEPPPMRNFVRTYPQQGWTALADQWPKPHVYASIRGGQLGGPHTHDDLLSWNGVIGIEKMILNYHQAGYYDSAWEWRAKEIYERNAASKNTLFIAGLSAYTGVPRHRSGPARADTSSFVLPTGPAVRLDATRAFVLTRYNPRLVCRLFAVLGDRGLLVLDRVEMPGNNPVEARAHTLKQAVFGKNDVLLKGDYETARLTFAADQPAVLRCATALLSDGNAQPPTVIRWQTRGNVKQVTLATLLTRGEAPVDLAVDSRTGNIEVRAVSGDWQATVRLTHDLQPIPATP